MQLIRPQFEDAALSTRRDCREKRELLAELLATRRQIGYQLVVRRNVLTDYFDIMISIHGLQLHKSLTSDCRIFFVVLS